MPDRLLVGRNRVGGCHKVCERLETDAECESGHHVGVSPGSCIEIGEVEQERRREAERSVHCIIEPHAEGNQPGRIGSEKVGVYESETRLQDQLRPVSGVGDRDPVFRLA